jgi:hypothetical protein
MPGILIQILVSVTGTVMQMLLRYKTDSGRTVLHASLDVTAEHPIPNEPGWLCRDIYENLQHTDLYYFIQSADTGYWYFKPRDEN